ncbi:peptidylprolyl isomerase [candidate division KSB1 bacterium]|nr:peptidylprolyl isomerase [candidate division KSB1 bacterium]
MKYAVLATLLLATMIYGCSGSGDNKLEKGTTIYDIAKSVSEKIPALNPDKNQPLVKGKDINISVGDLFTNLQQNAGNRFEQIKSFDIERTRGILTNTLKSMYEKELLLNEATKANFTVSQAEIDSVMNMQFERYGGKEKYEEFMANHGIDVDYAISNLKESMIISDYLDTTLKDKIAVTDEDINEAYNSDKTASVQHILLTTQGKSDSAKTEIYKEMERILEEAKSGADFGELAKKYSEDPGSKEKGGLYEDFPRGQMVKPFDEAAFNVPIGELSGIVETEYGYHILKIIDRKKETKPLEEVREQLQNKLENEHRREFYANLMDELKEKADLNIVEF